MEDKLIELLKLCREAHSKNINIELEFGLDSVEMFHFKKVGVTDYKIVKHMSAKFALPYYEKQIDDIANYLKELI